MFSSTQEQQQQTPENAGSCHSNLQIKLFFYKNAIHSVLPFFYRYYKANLGQDGNVCHL